MSCCLQERELATLATLAALALWFLCRTLADAEQVISDKRKDSVRLPLACVSVGGHGESEVFFTSMQENESASVYVPWCSSSRWFFLHRFSTSSHTEIMIHPTLTHHYFWREKKPNKNKTNVELQHHSSRPRRDQTRPRDCLRKLLTLIWAPAAFRHTQVLVCYVSVKFPDVSGRHRASLLERDSGVKELEISRWCHHVSNLHIHRFVMIFCMSEAVIRRTQRVSLKAL